MSPRSLRTSEVSFSDWTAIRSKRERSSCESIARLQFGLVSTMHRIQKIVECFDPPFSGPAGRLP